MHPKAPPFGANSVYFRGTPPYTLVEQRKLAQSHCPYNIGRLPAFLIGFIWRFGGRLEYDLDQPRPQKLIWGQSIRRRVSMRSRCILSESISPGSSEEDKPSSRSHYFFDYHLPRPRANSSPTNSANSFHEQENGVGRRTQCTESISRQLMR
jgi:hypothetical protein